MRLYLARLAVLCKKLGGELRLISDAEFTALMEPEDNPEWDEAPFTRWHAVNWKQRLIIAAEKHASLNGIIHEMGHVFADPMPPTASNEFDWLGWEIAVAKYVGCYRQWSTGNKDYCIGDMNWGEASARRKHELILDRIVEAQDDGILSAQLRPLAVQRY